MLQSQVIIHNLPKKKCAVVEAAKDYGFFLFMTRTRRHEKSSFSWFDSLNWNFYAEEVMDLMIKEALIMYQQFQQENFSRKI